MNFIYHRIKHSTLLGFLVFIPMALFYAQPSIAGDFKLVKQDEILSLYERWIAGETGGKVRELKAVFNVKSDIASITRLLTDPQKGAAWNSNARVYQILHSGNDNIWTTYIRYNIPWPFDDQDCCLLYRLSTGNSNTVEIIFNSTSNSRFPESVEVDRINGIRGKWLIDDLGDRNIKITYLITTNRSKKIPRWVSDPIIHNNLFNTMAAFKNLLEHPEV